MGIPIAAPDGAESKNADAFFSRFIPSGFNAPRRIRRLIIQIQFLINRACPAVPRKGP